MSAPRSLVAATDIDVLPEDRVIEQRDGYLLVRSPSNPAHYWGNYLLFDEAPSPGDAPRWEARFDAEFGQEPRVRHRAFTWDRTGSGSEAALDEFARRGYVSEESVGLVARADRVRAHPRENRQVVVRALDPAADADEEQWSAIVELQVAGREQGQDEPGYRAYSRARLDDLRALFRAGRGAWFVAVEPARGEIVAGCGVVVTDGRGRFQAVDTALDYRRRGICSRLVVDAARLSVDLYRAERFVIVADAGYHALGLYESLGFEEEERTFGVCLRPRE
ncbi:MAG: N-acetyltransferase [Thermoleophilia bacterium]|nr:N-acetyltransferase [Thermoleophilia bacterium]